MSICLLEEIARQIDDCECSLVFTTDEIVPKILQAVKIAKYGRNIKVENTSILALEILNKSDNLKEVIVVQCGGGQGGAPKGCVDYGTVLKQPINERLPSVQFDVENDLILLPYSSGTTGVPKGVMITHKNWTSLFLSSHV